MPLAMRRGREGRTDKVLKEPESLGVRVHDDLMACVSTVTSSHRHS